MSQLMNVPTSLKDERGSFCLALICRVLLCFIQIEVVYYTIFSPLLGMWISERLSLT